MAHAQLLVIFAKLAGAWLSARPISNLGLSMDNNAIQVASSLHLETILYHPSYRYLPKLWGWNEQLCSKQAQLQEEFKVEYFRHPSVTFHIVLWQHHISDHNLHQ